jgi:DNA polymerase III epsilon subunit-like protein
MYIISLDCEATGLSRYQDQIVQLGVCIESIDDLTGCVTGPRQNFSEFIRPTRVQMSRGASMVTGITMAMLLDKPTIGPVLRQLSRFIETACTGDEARLLVAYNGFGYDIPMMTAEAFHVEGLDPEAFFRGLRIDYVLDLLVWCRTHVDTTLLHRRADGKCSYKLGDLYQRAFQKPLAGAHGALADSVAVLDLASHPMCRGFYTGCNELLLSGGEPSTSTCAFARNPLVLIQSSLKQLRTKATPGKACVQTVSAMFGTHKRRRATTTAHPDPVVKTVKVTHTMASSDVVDPCLCPD